MSDKEDAVAPEASAAAPEVSAAVPPPRPADTRFGDLAELEQEIRRRLRSNQRFLERFLDEEFIDDEEEGDNDEPDEEEDL